MGKERLLVITALAFAVVVFVSKNNKDSENHTETMITTEKRQDEKLAKELSITKPTLRSPIEPTEKNTTIDTSDPDNVKEYYASGNIRRITALRDSKKHGVEKLYFDSKDKKVSKESSYFTGTKHGRQMEFFDNGKIKSVVNYQNDKEHGLAKYYYTNGKVKSECRYKEGKKMGQEKTFDEDGTLKEMKNWG